MGNISSVQLYFSAVRFVNVSKHIARVRFDQLVNFRGYVALRSRIVVCIANDICTHTKGGRIRKILRQRQAFRFWHGFTIGSKETNIQKPF